jgi:uncharacterized membrane protein YhiD involved in acid resistance
MNNVQELVDAFALQNTQTSIFQVVVNLVIAAFLAHLLSKIYVRCGNALSNRRAFARNFILMTTITALIITIVKSSLALSLGLVGALSIVRYRTAIKDPEELAYLFFAISIGLGLGADMRGLTIISFFVIICIIWLTKMLSKNNELKENLYLTIASPNDKLNIDQVVDVLDKHCDKIDLKRFDNSQESFEASFLVEFPSVSNLSNIEKDIHKISPDIKISFLDNKGTIL